MAVRLAAVETLRDQLVLRVLQHHHGQQVTPEVADALVRQLQREISRVPAATLYESLRPLIGMTLTPKLATEFAWRLAGNTRALRQGRPALPWTAQTEDEWSVFHILGMRGERRPDGRLGYRVRLLLMTGTGCPMTITVFWGRKFIPVLARRLGLTFSRGKYPYQHPLQIVGLRFLGKVERVLSLHEPRFHKIRVTPSLLARNRQEVLSYRARVTPCPERYNHPCHRCWVGWETCPGGVHRYDYVEQTCPRCGDEQALFDPEYGFDRCIACRLRGHQTYERARNSP